jgi:hypothetical protein
MHHSIAAETLPHLVFVLGLGFRVWVLGFAAETLPHLFFVLDSRFSRCITVLPLKRFLTWFLF